MVYLDKRVYMQKQKNPSVQILLLTVVFILTFCETETKPKDDDLGSLGPNQFYAQNIITDRFYKVTADRLWEGSTCVIWAERGSGVDTAQAQAIADKYDTVIRNLVVNAFSDKNFSILIEGEQYYFTDVLGLANWLGDGEAEKLTILLLDIKDGYVPGTSAGYVAGYFFAGNLYEKGPVRDPRGNILYYSNGRDMIYIDTYPGLNEESLEETYSTFAHELQHLINFYTTLFARTDQSFYYLMDTWIDEGLSSQAEYLYLGKNVEWKCEWFVDDYAGTIARGNNFFVWGNRQNQSVDAIYDDYATVYLFFRWLYLQSGGDTSLFRRIANSEEYNYLAVTEETGKDWETLLRRWFAANYNPADSDYGYRGDDYLKGMIRVKTISGSSISLYPGEGVYSAIKSNPNAAAGGPHIRYAGLTNTSSYIDTSPPYTGKVLLTYNANTRRTDGYETGFLTGVAPSPPSIARPAEDTLTRQFTRPRALDARDVMRNGRQLELPDGAEKKYAPRVPK